jgi:putative membrane protein
MLQDVAVGMVLGAFSGLLPGIHSNTVATLLSALPIPPGSFAYIIAALVGAHIVFSFFPSIFLSIPDDTVVASVLPGHKMALEGRGRQAIEVCALSAVLAAFASAVLLPIALIAIPIAYSAIRPHMAALLAAASLFLIASEKEAKKAALALAVFLLCGAFGLATMRAGIADPLFASFSGLFAASGILLSFTATKKIPEQKDEELKVDFLPYVAAGVLFGAASDLFAGIAAPAQIAVFASVFLPTSQARKFLALVSSIAASHSVFAFAALVSIGKAREGAIATANSISPINAAELPALAGALLLSISASAFILAILARHAGKLQNIDMKKLNLAVLAYLVFAVALISGAQGLLVFATATSIGMLPPLLGIRRTHVMGLIIIPSMLLSI